MTSQMPPITTLDPRALVARAASAQRSRRFREAEELYLAVLAAIPDQHDAQRLIGLLYAETSRPALAARFLSLASTTAPKSPATLHELGYGFLRIGDPQAALECLDLARALKPDVPDVWYHTGVASLQLERADEAFEALERAIALHPKHINALVELAKIRLRLGEFDHVRDLAERIEQIQPTRAEPIILRAQVCEPPQAPGLLDRAGPLIAREDAAARAPDLFTAAAQLNAMLGHTSEARRLIRMRNGATSSHYDQAATDNRVKRIEAIDDIEAGDTLDLGSENLVFVFGHPGSGVDRVLAALVAHAEFARASPVSSIPRLSREMNRYVPGSEDYPELLKDLSADAKRYLAQLHLNLQQWLPGTGFLIEGSYEGLFYLGTIVALFPRAKVVLVSRDLNHSSEEILALGGGMPYGHFGAPEDITHAIQCCERLCSHWRSLYRNTLDLRFEDFQDDVPAALTRLYEFVGASPNVPDPHKPHERVPTQPGSLWHVPVIPDPSASAPLTSLFR